MRGAVLSLLFTAISAQLPPLYCLDVDQNFCLSWLVAGPNITFSAQCTPQSTVIGWCAYGFSADGSMTPADVMMISSPDGKTAIMSDRNSTSYLSPPCASTAASTLLSSNIDANGVLTATWTRALAPGNGHYAIPNGNTFSACAARARGPGGARLLTEPLARAPAPPRPHSHRGLAVGGRGDGDVLLRAEHARARHARASAARAAFLRAARTAALTDPHDPLLFNLYRWRRSRSTSSTRRRRRLSAARARRRAREAVL